MTAARVLMVQGTASSVGKSTLTSALCRIFLQDGLRVAPFKAQNMSNNSYVTPDGGEVGRAQALQARAAGVELSTDMNPVLLKPEADNRSQVIVNGRSRGSMPARDYFKLKTALWADVTSALDRLRSQYDVVIVEGAGSPAEVNLRAGDIANMSVALYADAPVLLVGDIDRGGVFASLLGTLELLAPEERALVKGLVINRFRGDRAILEPLPAMIATRTGVPVVGVVPYVPDLNLADEDSASLGGHLVSSGSEPGPRAAVIKLPHISNFDDFDPLRRAGVEIKWATRPEHFDGAHVVILPGTKSTISDLQWLRIHGMDSAVLAAHKRGAAILGICGGYQMLCERLEDPLGADSGTPGSDVGIGLLPGTTVFHPEKSTRRVEFLVAPGSGMLAGHAAVHGYGYEIHTGHTSRVSGEASRVSITIDGMPDGAISQDGWVIGTYVHGLFDNTEVLSRLLGNIARKNGLPFPDAPSYSVESEIDRLAAVVREALDMKFITSLVSDGASAKRGEA